MLAVGDEAAGVLEAVRERLPFGVAEHVVGDLVQERRVGQPGQHHLGVQPRPPGVQEHHVAGLRGDDLVEDLAWQVEQRGDVGGELAPKRVEQCFLHRPACSICLVGSQYVTSDRRQFRCVKGEDLALDAHAQPGLLRHQRFLHSPA